MLIIRTDLPATANYRCPRCWPCFLAACARAFRLNSTSFRPSRTTRPTDAPRLPARFFQCLCQLSATAMPALSWLMRHATTLGFVPLWHGLRLLAADAWSLRFGHRAGHVPRAASSEQIAFGLYLPGPELMLTASLHSVHENERQMLFEHLDLLGAGDLLLVDPGYPCRWLVALPNKRRIGFCMRVEKAGNAGFACARDFLRSGLQEKIVTLAAPDKDDAQDYECSAEAQSVRLVRHVASQSALCPHRPQAADAFAAAALWHGCRPAAGGNGAHCPTNLLQ